MTLIMHRCLVCAHPDLYHSADDRCCAGHCRAGRHTLQPGPSAFLVTYNRDTGAVTRSLVPPGTAYSGFGFQTTLTTCGCDRCHSLYAQYLGHPGSVLS